MFESNRCYGERNSRAGKGVSGVFFAFWGTVAIFSDVDSISFNGDYTGEVREGVM